MGVPEEQDGGYVLATPFWLIRYTLSALAATPLRLNVRSWISWMSFVWFTWSLVLLHPPHHGSTLSVGVKPANERRALDSLHVQGNYTYPMCI